MATLGSAIWAVWYMSKQIQSDRLNTQNQIFEERKNLKLQIIHEHKKQFMQVFNNYESLIIKTCDTLGKAQNNNVHPNDIDIPTHQILSTFSNFTELVGTLSINMPNKIKDNLNEVHQLTIKALDGNSVSELFLKALIPLKSIRIDLNQWYQQDIENHLN